jgi:methyl-accepting chemotaxis protein
VIVGIINEISEQIKLLSLNAAIEAARPEMRGGALPLLSRRDSKLADQQRRAYKDIERLIAIIMMKSAGYRYRSISSIAVIAGMIESLNTVSVSMQQITGRMQQQVEVNRQMNDRAHGVREQAETIKNATEEHKLAISDIVRSITNINELTQFNAQGAGEMANNSGDLSKAAENMKRAVDFFRIE